MTLTDLQLAAAPQTGALFAFRTKVKEARDGQGSQAAVKYSILSIGDGLVAQIPAMFIAIAAGAVVTRVINDDSRNLGADITNQLFAEPRAMAIAGGALTLIGLLPGFPLSVFWGLAGLMGGAAFLIHRSRQKATVVKTEADLQAANLAAKEAGETDEPLPDWIRGDLYAIVLHPDTRRLLAERGLDDEMREAAKALRHEVGFRYPGFGFRSSRAMSPENIRIEVGDVPAAEFPLKLSYALPASASGVLDAGKVPYTADQAADGSTRLVIQPADFESAKELGFVPSNPIQLACDDIIGVVRRNIALGFGINEAAKWLEELQPKLGRLVNDVQQTVPLLRIVDVCRKLLEEGHTLAQPRIILETLLRRAAEPDHEKLMDAVRNALRQQIIHRLTGGAKIVPIIAIAPDVEQRLQEPQKGAPPITPAERQEVGRAVIAQINTLQAKAALGGQRPIIATTSSAVPVIRNFLARRGVRLPTMAIEDFDERITTTVIGVVSTAKTRPAA